MDIAESSIAWYGPLPVSQLLTTFLYISEPDPLADFTLTSFQKVSRVTKPWATQLARKIALPGLSCNYGKINGRWPEILTCMNLRAIASASFL